MSLIDVECPKPAYERIVNSELKERILKRAKKVSDITLYGFDDSADRLFKIARRNFDLSDRVNEERDLWREFLELEDEIKKQNISVSSAGAYEMLSRYPCVLGYAVLEGDLFDFGRFGFPNRKSLQEAITSFCIGERQEFNELLRREDYFWRGNNGNTKNNLSNGFHGDLYAGQIDVSGKDLKEETLFGSVDNFDSVKYSDERKGISVHYGAWSPFLISALKYAEHLGQKNMSIIKNWKQALDSVGGAVGTNTAECEFGGSDSYWHLENMLKNSLVVQGREISMENHPICISAGEKVVYYPFVDSDGKMSYVLEDEKGEVELPAPRKSIWEGKKYQKILEYDADDLDNLLKGTYRLFARDRGELNYIMDVFNGQLRLNLRS